MTVRAKELDIAIKAVQEAGKILQANYVWVNASHFSDYSVGGENICPFKGDRPVCGIVSMRKVITYIYSWVARRADISDVRRLIDAWVISNE